jgi:acetolactate synthase-1/2/3 large subunit
VVDIDPAEINKTSMPINVPVCVDAKAFIQEWMLQSKSVVPEDRSNWLARCKAWQAKYPVVLPEYWHEQDYVNNYVLIEVLSDEMSSEIC